MHRGKEDAYMKLAACCCLAVPCVLFPFFAICANSRLLAAFFLKRDGQAALDVHARFVYNMQ